ncbi:hypothetical protein RB195_011592 [Necator americanus]|uniref:Endonuclease/exonuclease/phosphatase domain-containing protein n=1 Tax=Necator americanus TaxID=51031 RepID=A0ABR1D4H4_NECAM
MTSLYPACPSGQKLASDWEVQGRRNRKESPGPRGKPGTVAPGRTGLQESYRLPKRKRTIMAICTYNARKLASEVAIEDLMMQAKKIKYDEHATVEVLVELASSSTRLWQRTSTLSNNLRLESYEKMWSNISFDYAYAPTSSYDEEEVEAFYMDLEKFYREDHAFYKIIIGDFNAKTTSSSIKFSAWRTSLLYQSSIRDRTILSRGRFSFTRRAEKAAKFRGRNPRTIINWDLFAASAGFWEDSAIDNIDEEYDRLVEHLHNCAKKAESSKTTKRRLSLETLELIRQRGAVRAAGNQELTSEPARLCREAIKEDLKERRAEPLAEAEEAGKSIHRAFASRKTRMTVFRNPKGTTIALHKGDGENHLRLLLRSLRQPLASSPS